LLRLEGVQLTDKLKIVWICHFTDSQVQSILKPWRKKAQFAPWITYTLRVFEDRNDLELHIVSPHEYISGVKEYEKSGVHYHFFNPCIPIWGRHWPGFFKWDVWTNYARNKRKVRRIVDSIKPEIIHLHGAENPYYSTTVLPLMGRYPIVVNIQRFDKSSFAQNDTRSINEQSILTNARNISIRTKTMHNDISEYLPDSRLFWVKYSMPEYRPITVKKEYDVVFFAQVGKAKGIEDLLDAVAILKQHIKNLKMCVIGSVSKSYATYLQEKARTLGISDTIIWKGRLPELSDVHLEASKAKVSVLPTYNDIISGTIIESMQLGLPVVSYKTGSIPELNEDRENVLLSDKGDIDGLANNILRLLTDDELYKTMSRRGIECIRERYSNQNVLQQHLDCYREVIADFHRDKQQKLTTENTEKHRHR
jgi:glycosyltransferase involved in cell wall biosynthesis